MAVRAACYFQNARDTKMYLSFFVFYGLFQSPSMLIMFWVLHAYRDLRNKKSKPVLKNTQLQREKNNDNNLLRNIRK